MADSQLCDLTIQPQDTQKVHGEENPPPIHHSVGVAIITYNARKHLPYCLPPLLNSPLKPKVLVVNSSSKDGTIELARELEAETLVIPRNEFNHGTTRERARRYLASDIVVMMTPDAYAADETMLEKLIAPIAGQAASISYARQIPRDGAGFFESFSRSFNYPPHSHIRSLKDINVFGSYLFFCSNACAAYSSKALDQIGGFPHVLLGEDTVAAARLLKQGHRIAYVAEAIVRHSHCYTLFEELRRHFDTGLSRKIHEELLFSGGSDAKRGMEYFLTMLRHLKRKPHLLPYACIHTFIKWMGYQIGRKSVNAPRSFKKIFSSQDFYWLNE